MAFKVSGQKRMAATLLRILSLTASSSSAAAKLYNLSKISARDKTIMLLCQNILFASKVKATGHSVHV